MRARQWLHPLLSACVAALLVSCGGRSVVHLDDAPGVTPKPDARPVVPTDGGPNPIFDVGPLPPPPPYDLGPNQIAERVTCEFYGSNSIQECASTLGQGCAGVSSCTVVVWADPGTAVAWKSTCGGQARTIVDGYDEVVGFDCPLEPPPEVYEAVTCRFYGSTSTQECYSSLGASCKGVTSCVVKLSGPPGILVDWKSTCGGYASTVLDGIDEDAAFKCPAPPPPPPPQVTEVVTCMFDNSNMTQECYSSLGPSCKGIYSCSVTLSGPPGIVVDWKSTCGGYASTVLDGYSEDAWFFCEEEPPPPPLQSETVTCLFLNSTTLQECYSSLGASCQGVSSCQVPVTGLDGDQIVWKSTCGNYAHTVIDGFDEYATFQCGGTSPTPY